MEPTITDPETPEEPAENPDEITMDGEDLNAAGDEHTVSIKDYSSIRKLVDVTVTGGTALTVDGKSTAKEGTAFTLAVKVKDSVNNYKIKSVKSGETEATVSGSTYTLALGSTITADAEVEIELAEVYTVEVDNQGETTYGITLDKSLNAAAGEAETATVTIADGASKVIEKGSELKFTISGYTAADDRLQAYYLTDGSEDAEDLESIEIVETEEGETTKTTVYTATVPANVINALDASIKIVLVKDVKKAVTITPDANVRVSYWGKTTEGTTETETWVDENDASAVKSAFVGDTFKFKLTGINSRKVSKVTVNGDTIAVTENGEYEITVEDTTTIAVETTVDSVSSNTLTFTLEGDESSAEAEITSLTDGSEEVTGIAAFLGLESAKLKVGTAVNVPKTVTAMQVTVRPASGWELKPVTGEDTAPASRVYKFATTADAENGVVAISEAMTVAAATDVEKATAAHYFKVTLSEDGVEDVNKKLSNLNVTVEADKVTKKGEGDEVYYAVAEGVQTVTFTVDVKEGSKLNLAPATAVKSNVAGAVANEKATYTVTLFANKLTGTTDTFADAQEITATPEDITLKVEQDPETSEDFSITYESKTSAEGAEYEAVANKNALPYGVALRATVVPADGSRLEKVSYTMGGDPVEATIDYNEVTRKNEAVIEIPKVTADVKVIVESGKDYQLMPLADANDNDLYPDDDGIYTVEYGEKYLVGVTHGAAAVPARNVSVVVTDASGNTVAMTNPIINGKRSINLATKSLAGQEITADIYVRGVDEAIGTYILNVKKKTTALTVNGGEEINQDVDSIAYYDIETDGELPATGNVSVTGDLASLITPAIVNGRLRLTVDPAATADVMTITTTGSGDTAATTKTSKEATITVTAPDDEDVTASIKVTLNPLFDKDAKPSVSEVAVADTVINVNVGMGDVKTPRTGSVWYEVTYTAKADTPASGDTPASTKPTELTAGDTIYVRKTGDNQRVALQVGTSDLLGEGAEWEYNVTAKLIYNRTGSQSGTLVEASAVSDALATGTKTPLFEDSLKLKKGKNGTLYTGQSGEFVIATPQFTKKFNSYKIVSDNITDDKGDLNRYLKVNDNGDIVVTNVPNNADLGKHTITVVATADQTGMYDSMGQSHTMYASRATVSVNIVKGINNLDIVTPSHSVYKAPGKAASLKLKVEYNNGQRNLNGKKWMENPAPKSKKVNWEITGVHFTDRTSGEWEEAAVPANISSNVTVKNGNVSVNKNFARDERHYDNNFFAVKVTAADFEGNEVEATTGPIEITSEMMTVSKVVLAIYEDGKFKVVAVQDGKTAQQVSAKDINGAYVFAVGADSNAAAGNTYSYNQLWSKLKVEDPGNTTVTTNSKKLVEVYTDDEYDDYPGWPWIKVLGAGKKVNVTVAANDGGKKKNALPLDLGYTDNEGKDLALKISASTGTDYSNFRDYTVDVYSPAKVETKVEKDFTVTGAARLKVDVMLGNAAEGKSTTFNTYANGYTNYKLTVKGGKLISNGYGTAYVTTTGKVTTLTLTDPSVPKGEKAKVYTYVLTNKAYDGLAKAPKVTVAGSLHEDGTEKEQTITMNVLDAANKNAVFAKTDTVKVEVDWSTRTDKNGTYLNRLSNALADNNNGSQIFAFADALGNVSLPLYHQYGYTSGSYKVRVTVGTGTGASFKPKTLPATATIKVTKNKEFTFKPTTSYTINKVDGGAILTGRSNVSAKAGELTWMDFYRLQNVNVKGTSNNFTHYFTIVEDDLTHTQRLTLNESDPLVRAMLYEPEKNTDGTDKTDANGNVILSNTKKENPTITIPKEDLTGYVLYEAGPSVGYYTNADRYNGIYGTAKITVKIAADPKNGAAAKPSQKFVPENAEIALTNGKTEVNMLVNGAYVSVAQAIVDTEKKGNSEELALDTPAVNAKGQIALKTAGAVTEGKSYSLNLIIVPTSSYYAETIAKTTDAAAKEALIKQYGIAVKVTVKASATPKKTADPTAVDDDDNNDEPVKDAAAAKTLIESGSWTGFTVKKAADGSLDAESKTAAETSLKTEVENRLRTAGYSATVAAKDGLQYTTGAETATISFDITVDGTTVTATISIAAVTDEEPDTPAEIDSLKIFLGSDEKNTDEITLTQGQDGEKVYTVKAYDAENAEIADLSGQTFTWEVTGDGKKDATKFSEQSTGTTGTLTIASDETVTTLTVKVTSVNGKIATLTLTVTPAQQGGT